MRQREIVIYRHWEVLQETAGFIRSDQITKAADQYDRARIRGGMSNETGLEPDLVITSHSKRSIDTARQLFGRVDIEDAAFREAELPDLVSLPLMLLPHHWFVVARVCWFLGASRNCENAREFRARAHRCAIRLDDLARQHDRIAIVGHGVMNRYLARELRALGYSGRAKPDSSYGQANRFTFGEP